MSRTNRVGRGGGGMIPPFITATFQPDNTRNTTANGNVASFLVVGSRNAFVSGEKGENCISFHPSRRVTSFLQMET